ncbi:transporter [Aspergillus sclerotialis]|uniref:Transporter n=1 Tax=Aspergillus sclerotialis TaxID=2070753 RepID=A0A3A2ZGL5_9EURO|nr:transporter [Aspergillus sclerotialis]
MYAASAIAANTIARSACGAAAPLFTNQMFSALGVGGGGSLIGGVATVLAFIPFVFYKYGKQIRIRSRFAPTDARPQEKSDEETGRPEGVRDHGSESRTSESEITTSQTSEDEGEKREQRVDQT